MMRSGCFGKIRKDRPLMVKFKSRYTWRKRTGIALEAFSQLDLRIKITSLLISKQADRIKTLSTPFTKRYGHRPFSGQPQS